MGTTAVETLNNFIHQTSNHSDNSRQRIEAEIEAFAELVTNRAETLPLIDFCYWRKAIEDVLAHGQRRLYERYETDTSARQEANSGHRDRQNFQ